MPLFTLGLTIETVRVPELIEKLELKPTDFIVVYDPDINKTRKVGVSVVSNYITSPSGGDYIPVQNGDTLLYIVPASGVGNDEINIPALAGKNVKLNRGGFPLIPQETPSRPDAEYEMLGSGGVKLLNGATLLLDERYELEVFELSDGVTPGGGGGGSGGFIVGEVPVNTNINISVNDVNKIHQVRAGSTALTITLPDIDDCPENSFLIIESIISNTKQHLINTTGAQYIYRRNQSIDNGIYLGVGEVLWFYRGEDGWYVISEKGEWDNIGNPIAAYKAGLNQIVFDGQEFLRATYPKLWRMIQTFGASLVDEGTWQTASVVISGRTVLRPYRGCWSTGDGSTTFRVPDYMNMVIRGVKTEGGGDTERILNAPGGFQDSTMEKFWPGSPTKPVIMSVDGNFTETSTDNDPGLNQPNLRTPLVIDKTAFSTETRMENIGVLWVTNF